MLNAANDSAFKPLNQEQRLIRLSFQPGRIVGRLGSLSETSHPFYRHNDQRNKPFARANGSRLPVKQFLVVGFSRFGVKFQVLSRELTAFF